MINRFCEECGDEFCVPINHTYKKFCGLSCSAKHGGKLSSERHKLAYLSCPKKCKHCGEIIDYDQKLNQFCSRSCAGAYNGSRKPERTEASKNKTSIALTGRASPFKGIRKKDTPIKQKIQPVVENVICGPYTKIYLRTCKFSGIQWYSASNKILIHPELARNRQEYAYSCQFKFGLNLYPKWFTNVNDLITKYGWYSASNRNNNLNGISRDHMFSISDGWINNIPPHIIRHPANCALMPHKTNQHKNAKSNITIDELYSRISLFDSILHKLT